MQNAYTRVQRLLREMQAIAPIKVEQAERPATEVDDAITPQKFIAYPPDPPASSLPTFQIDTTRPLSPMLQARFDFASTIRIDTDIWLGISEMARWPRKRAVRSYHRALRENWNDSAPMKYPDTQLTLFGVTEDVPDSLMYLVWQKQVEPEVWVYSGMQANTFTNLEGYLTWYATNG